MAASALGGSADTWESLAASGKRHLSHTTCWVWRPGVMVKAGHRQDAGGGCRGHCPSGPRVADSCPLEALGPGVTIQV